MPTPLEIVKARAHVFGSQLSGPYWPDEGTYHYSASDVNTVGVSELDGKSCAYFNHQDSESLEWSAPDFTENVWSLAFWVEANQFPNDQFFYVGGNSTGQLNGMRLQFSTSSEQYSIFSVLVPPTGDAAIGLFATGKFHNERMHLALRYNKPSEELKFYRDASLMSTVDLSSSGAITNSYFRFRSNMSSATSKASQLIATNGAADQLTEADITDLYNSGDVPDWGGIITQPETIEDITRKELLLL